MCIAYPVAGHPCGPLHRGQSQVHNVHHFAMGQGLCLQCTHGVLLHLCKQPYRIVLLLAGVACVERDTDQIPLRMYRFLPV